MTLMMKMIRTNRVRSCNPNIHHHHHNHRGMITFLIVTLYRPIQPLPPLLHTPKRMTQQQQQLSKGKAHHCWKLQQLPMKIVTFVWSMVKRQIRMRHRPHRPCTEIATTVTDQPLLPHSYIKERSVHNNNNNNIDDL